MKKLRFKIRFRVFQVVNGVPFLISSKHYGVGDVLIRDLEFEASNQGYWHNYNFV